MDDSATFQGSRRILTEILGPQATVTFAGRGELPSAFAVSDLAAASVAAAGVGVADYLAAFDGAARAVTVDRRLASFWFQASLFPLGWDPPPIWDAVAGDYRAADGWIRLHTNAPHHRRAALGVLGVGADRDAVARVVARRSAAEIETAVVAAGGCAAAMRTPADWAASPQGKAVAAEPLIDWRDTGPATMPEGPVDPVRPLSGVRILDLTRVLAGPVATRFLACLGADVLRIDPPDWDEPAALLEVMLGKRSVRLDLRDEGDRAIFARLLAGADLLVHGYRPGALDGLGFGAAARRALRPGLIEVTLDAYGWTGPWAGRRGFDSLMQMSTGIADAGMRHYAKDRPFPLPVQALDHATGYLMAFAALTALAARRREGRAMQARLSLARTAHLLLAHPVEEVGPAFDRVGEGDFGPAVEETGWGPAKRLAMPLGVENVVLGSPLPARVIGGDTARW
ncbi:CoA transferase [Zavarzinia compransoris]|uniref:CoA transferase n=1 Tax=Zavarzinia marina TaxID=2911065 RepID=UPI001F1882E4|nr:CoA transferase [Zavarzinia marina]MCF4165078.1 CoA transferase [Zavarzinia marina]